MSKRILETLWDSRARVKILKLFFRNTDRGFEVKEIAYKIQERLPLVKQEMRRLLAVGLFKKYGQK